MFIEGGGSDIIDGGDDIDTVDYSNLGAGQSVDASLVLGGDGSAVSGSDTDTLRNIENIIGSDAADTLTGSSADNQLSGGSGNDTLTGAAGDDTLDGGDDTDTVDYSANTNAQAIVIDLANQAINDDGQGVAIP